MKIIMRSKSAKSESLEQRFKRFATALMAVPKKEIDKASKRTARKPKGKGQSKSRP